MKFQVNIRRSEQNQDNCLETIEVEASDAQEAHKKSMKECKGNDEIRMIFDATDKDKCYFNYVTGFQE